MSKKQVTLERTFRAPIADVWALWTTKDGIESWWGPDGFAVTVEHLDLRVGGELRYLMRAVAAEQVAFMQRANMPVVHPARFVYTEIAPNQRLAYRHDVDFVPGVAAYAVDTVVELAETPAGVRMVLRLDPMHDDEWTRRATMGWDQQLGKLDKVLGCAA
jgi:uncharacterized protein YndB with AHSA1/START domain